MDSVNTYAQNETARIVVGFLIFAVAVTAVVILYRYVTRKLARRARRTQGLFDDFVIDVLRMPFLLLLIWIMFRIFSQTVFYDTRYFGAMNHAIEILVIVTVGWILIKLTRILFYVLEKKLDAKADKDMQVRGSLTKKKIFERMIAGLIVVVVVAVCLMTFDKIRAVGVSLLTSAGIAGIIVGFAAQKSLGMILAGIQLAITQPIRLDDSVIVEGEMGVIEEIKLTYVVVRLWDQRRLILPVTYFLEKPFQNWTINSAQLLGTVYLYLDYGMPLEALRRETERILRDHPKWDGRASNVQVTDMKERYMEVRVLFSSSDSGSRWDLSVDVREKLLKFLQDNYPDCFVRTRIMDVGPAAKDGSAGE